METNGTCQFYVTRKRRMCTMLVKAGKKFCGQHMVVENDKNTQHKRIPCPLDPKHSCFEHRLEHHLSVCNAKAKETTVEYIKKGCNMRMCGDVTKIPIASLNDSQLLAFLSKVHTIHSEYVGSIETSIKEHDAVIESATKVNKSSIPGGIRHLAQNASLLGHMRDSDLLNTDKQICYVEFGAGKGQMTHWLTQTVSDKSKATFVLVDRSPQRYKCDAKMKFNDSLNVQRLRVDIKDLDLTGLSELQNCKHIVSVGKHLCGGATDLALECISKCSGSKMALGGVIIALCCHHRCSWTSYVNTQFFQEIGFSPEEFYTLTSLTSWATCNPKKSQKLNTQNHKASGQLEMSQKGEESQPDSGKSQQVEKGQGESENSQRESEISRQELENGQRESGENSQEKKENRYKRLGLSPGQREEAGRWAKQLLDEGRARFLRLLGLDARLVQYVNTSTTPENVAIVAWRH